MFVNGFAGYTRLSMDTAYSLTTVIQIDDSSKFIHLYALSAHDSYVSFHMNVTNQNRITVNFSTNGYPKSDFCGYPKPEEVVYLSPS